MSIILAPDYYAKFQCIGSRCQDTCCSGWNISIDYKTYQKYEHSEHPVLAPLFKLALGKNTTPSANSDVNFGLMQMKSDGCCHFLQEDQLCAIQCHMGAKALSHTCQSYPRYYNQFGSQRENALAISCPEAARLILLNPEPMQFGPLAPNTLPDNTPHLTYRFPLQNDGDPEQIAVLNDFRAVIIAILQCRKLSLGARVMALGFLLEEANAITSSEQFAHATELQPTLQDFAAMLAHPAQIETQFAQIDSQPLHKLELITDLIAHSLATNASPSFRECLLSAAEGLAPNPKTEVLCQYTAAYHAVYQPFFQQHGYIFENYLVNQVITRLFPFTRSSYLDLYREMVFNLAILQVLLVGIGAHQKGLTEERVVQLFQSFARKSDHNRAYLKTLLRSLNAPDQDSFINIMWLLKES